MRRVLAVLALAFVLSLPARGRAGEWRTTYQLLSRGVVVGTEDYALRRTGFVLQMEGRVLLCPGPRQALPCSPDFPLRSGGFLACARSLSESGGLGALS